MNFPSNLTTRVATGIILLVCILVMHTWRWIGLIGWSLVTLEILLYEWPQFHLWWLTPLYPLMPLMLILYATAMHQDHLVILVILLSALFDSGGYVYGSMKGKRLLAPTISPKKTWEGLIASFIVLFLVAPLVIRLIAPEFSFSFTHLSLFLFCYGIIALLGDLFESFLKRRVHIKDSSNLLPGHGGLLDRLDSVLLPLLFVYGIHYFLLI